MLTRKNVLFADVEAELQSKAEEQPALMIWSDIG